MKPLLVCLISLCGWVSHCHIRSLGTCCHGQKTKPASKQSTTPGASTFPSSLAKASSAPSDQLPQTPTIKLTHEGRTFVGRQLAWDGKQLAMLRLDGELRLIPVQDKSAAKIVSPKFEPYTPSELKIRLKREFGDRYDVSTTKSCVVVHPWGKAEYWAEPFELMIQRFETYFTKHKVELAKSQFTFIVIVMRSRKDFDRYMHNETKLHNGNVVGFYSRLSNRMVTYDPSGLVRKPGEKSWLLGSQTMFHESAHQLAFNRGLHNRFSPPPLWLSEGLATLFETSGVNQKRLKSLQKFYEQRKISGQLDRLVSYDSLFQIEPELAYSLAWGMAHYLSKQNPGAFFAFLKENGARPNFQVLSPPQRLTAFAKHFGNDLDQIEEDMRSFYR